MCSRQMLRTTHQPPRHALGMSLLELLTVLLLVTSLLLAGSPALNWLLLDARRTADINAFVTAVQLARSESAKRSAPVIICKTQDFQVCGGSDVAFEDGWMVLVDTSGAYPPGLGSGAELLFQYQPVIQGMIRSNRARYTFRRFSPRSTNGTVTFCDSRGAEAARAVIISYTGRPRVSDRAPGGSALVCAS